MELFQTPMLGNKSGLGESRRVLPYMNFRLLKVQSENSVLTTAKPRDRGFSQIFWAYPEANLVTLVRYSIPWLLFKSQELLIQRRKYAIRNAFPLLQNLNIVYHCLHCLYQIE